MAPQSNVTRKPSVRLMFCSTPTPLQRTLRANLSAVGSWRTNAPICRWLFCARSVAANGRWRPTAQVGQHAWATAASGATIGRTLSRVISGATALAGPSAASPTENRRFTSHTRQFDRRSFVSCCSMQSQRRSYSRALHGCESRAMINV
jgi:hypothetical protein